MYENSFRLRGKTYDYKIQYEHIKKFMLLPKPDDLHTLIVIGLEPPLRQGQTRYPFLVMQFKREEEVVIELNMTEFVNPVRGGLSRNWSNSTRLIISFQGTTQREIRRQAGTSIRGVATCSRGQDLPRPDRQETHHPVQRLHQVRSIRPSLCRLLSSASLFLSLASLECSIPS